MNGIQKAELYLLCISFVCFGLWFVLTYWGDADSPQCGMSMHGPANISAGNNIAIFTTGTFEWNQSFMKDLEYNRSFHIPANATENWTIWKGDEVVCYIPRGI